jgi:hypothetical protein
MDKDNIEAIMLPGQKHVQQINRNLIAQLLMLPPPGQSHVLTDAETLNWFARVRLDNGNSSSTMIPVRIAILIEFFKQFNTMPDDFAERVGAWDTVVSKLNEIGFPMNELSTNHKIEMVCKILEGITHV